jgi:hypothetical protein
MMTGILMAGITALAGPLYSSLGHLAFATMIVPPLLAILALVAYRRLAASPKAPAAGG